MAWQQSARVGVSHGGAVRLAPSWWADAGMTAFCPDAQSYRSTLPKNSLNKVFYTPSKLVTIASMGGWSKVWAQFFGTTGLFTRIENAHGFTS